MMDWFGQEWWRLVWVPMLGLGLTWLAATWKTQTDARSSRDARLDSRMDRQIAGQDAENARLREQRDAAEAEAIRWESLAKWWWRKAHDMAHALLSARWGARKVMEKHGEQVPDTWDEVEELPPLEQPPKPPAP